MHATVLLFYHRVSFHCWKVSTSRTQKDWPANSIAPISYNDQNHEACHFFTKLTLHRFQYSMCSTWWRSNSIVFLRRKVSCHYRKSTHDLFVLVHFFYCMTHTTHNTEITYVFLDFYIDYLWSAIQDETVSALWCVAYRTLCSALCGFQQDVPLVVTSFSHTAFMFWPWHLKTLKSNSSGEVI